MGLLRCGSTVLLIAAAAAACAKKPKKMAVAAREGPKTVELASAWGNEASLHLRLYGSAEAVQKAQDSLARLTALRRVYEALRSQESCEKPGPMPDAMAAMATTTYTDAAELPQGVLVKGHAGLALLKLLDSGRCSHDQAALALGKPSRRECELFAWEGSQTGAGAITEFVLSRIVDAPAPLFVTERILVEGGGRIVSHQLEASPQPAATCLTMTAQLQQPRTVKM